MVTQTVTSGSGPAGDCELKTLHQQLVDSGQAAGQKSKHSSSESVWAQGPGHTHCLHIFKRPVSQLEFAVAVAGPGRSYEGNTMIPTGRPVAQALRVPGKVHDASGLDSYSHGETSSLRSFSV